MQTVAIVDGNPNIRKLVMMTLGDKFRYLEASDVANGIDLILKELPAVVIVSQSIGGASGVDMCKTIKKVHGLANILFILLFDEQKPKDAEIAEAGINGAVPKKLLTRFLKDEVKRCLNPQRVSPSVSWVDTRETPYDVKLEQPQVETHLSTNSLHPTSPPNFHKRVDTIRLPDQELADSSHIGKTSGEASYTFRKRDLHFKGESCRDLAFAHSNGTLNGEYRDPVKSFLEDGTVDYVYPARKGIGQEQSRPMEHVVGHKPLQEHGAAFKQKPASKPAARDAEISALMHKAIVEAIKETIPLFKDQLIAALEEKLKGLK